MPQVARQLGRYQVLDRIAFGGMAEIFRALTYDERGEARLVAIKQVLTHYCEDREFIDMLVDEAKLVSMLRHWNIVEIYEVAYFDGVYFVAMEYVPGKDVRAILERCRARGFKVPFEVSAHIMAEALCGLDTAHRLRDPSGEPAGLVHRDFSPSNILVSYSGDVKICDFGIAKANFSRIQTKTGIIKGKVKYMSPEQAFGRKLDHRSDLFSAGSVFYEMLTSDAPFLAPNEIDLIFMVRDAHITPPRHRDPSIPDELEHVVYRAMARARGARFQSAAEFRHTLLTYLRNRGAGDWRSELSRFMRGLYRQDIETEQASLAAFELQPAAPGQDVGQNLIADVLGANAPYTKFNPYPTSAHRPGVPREVHGMSTQIIRLAEAEHGAAHTDDAPTMSRPAPYVEQEPPSDEAATALHQAPPVADQETTNPWGQGAPQGGLPATVWADEFRTGSAGPDLYSESENTPTGVSQGLSPEEIQAAEAEATRSEEAPTRIADLSSSDDDPTRIAADGSADDAMTRVVDSERTEEGPTRIAGSPLQGSEDGALERVPTNPKDAGGTSVDGEPTALAEQDLQPTRASDPRRLDPNGWK